MHAQLWAFVFGVALARADFSDPIINIEESDAAVRCSVIVDCSGKAECIGEKAWTTTSGKEYRGNKMFITDDAQRAECTVGFRGSTIALYGMRQKAGASGEYSVDSGPSVPFSWAADGDDKEEVTSLFRAVGLDPRKNHTLRVEVHRQSADNVAPSKASVDFFSVTDPFAPKKDDGPGSQPPKNSFGGGHGHGHEHEHEHNDHADEHPHEHDGEMKPPKEGLNHELHPPANHGHEHPPNDHPAQAFDKPKEGAASGGDAHAEIPGGSEETQPKPQVDLSQYSLMAGGVVVFLLLLVGFKLRRQIMRLIVGRRSRATTRRRQVDEEIKEENEALLK